MIQRRHILKIAWSGVLLATLAVAPAQAAEPLQSITASPTTERLEIAGGGTYDGTVTISNTGQTAYQFNVAASPFSVSGEDYTQSFTARPDLVDASKWFSFPRSQYSSVSGSKTTVPYRIKVPSDIAAGGYYAVLFAEAKAPNVNEGVTSHKRVGVLFYITVSGKTISQGNLAGYAIPLIHTSAPLNAQIHLQNTGNVHFDANVALVVSDIFGNTKAKLESTNIILPKSTRKINLEWNKAPAFGFFRVTGKVDYLGKTEKLPVKYTLLLSAQAFVVMFAATFVLLVYAFMSRKRRRNVYRRR